MRIRAFHEGEADGDLCAETNDCSGDVGIYERGDGGVDIARVGRENGAEKEEYLAGPMRRCVA